MRHSFRSIGGKVVEKNLTPLAAIREQCIQCVQSPMMDTVEDCKGELCSLFPYRFGYDPDKKDASRARWDSLTEEERAGRIARMKSAQGSAGDKSSNFESKEVGQ